MDPAKILIWNVRGLNSSATQDSIATLVSTTRVNIVCLQETKFATVSQRILLSMLGSDFSNFVELPPPGASGGILVAWKNSVGSTRQVKVGVHSVLVQFRLQAGQTWWLTCVYGPRANDEKNQFLQELRDIKLAAPRSLVIAGDFNLIYKVEDKNNNYNRAMMGWFRRLIDDLGLKDIPLHCRKFTWSNHQANPTLVCLDRVFCTAESDSFTPTFCSKVLPLKTLTTHHCPLLVFFEINTAREAPAVHCSLNDVKPGRKRFHFEAFWPKIDGFLETVQQAWNSVQSNHCPFLTLDNKFKAAARGLQAWSDKNVGHVESQLTLAREILH
jgi:hypothetical protein